MSTTLPARFFDNAARFGSEPVHYYNGGNRWFPIGWQTMAGLVRAIGSGLVELGHVSGDPVAIVSATRREWIYCDLATLSCGGVTVGVYPTLTASQVHYILEHCEAKYCIVEDADQLAKVMSVADRLPALRKLIVIDSAGAGGSDDRVVFYDDLCRLGRAAGHDIQARIAELTSADAATFIYTSGTTGPPKGAMITHGSIVAALRSLDRVPLTRADFGFSFLPLAHALQRVVDYNAIWRGVCGAYGRSMATVAGDLAVMRPTVMAAVPRIFEKIYAGVHDQVEQGPPAAQRAFVWACSVGRRVSQARTAGKPIPAGLSAQYAVAKRLVFDKLRDRLGGRIRLFITGGAPIAVEILEFFDAAGISILEGWGMTETFATGTINLPAATRFGSVGRPLDGVALRLDDDGELLVKGDMLFSGYFKEDDATAAAFTSDGYFRTGDIARVDHGYYYIIDRKKDLIITAGGKNIAPQNIENLIKSDSRVSQIVVIGDRRPYLTALVSVTDELRGGMSESQLNMLVESVVAKRNLELPRFEQIKKFRLLPHDLSEESGELTPTLKVKRKVVSEKFSYLIDEMYD